MKIIQARKEDLPEILTIQKIAFYSVGKFYKNFRIHPLMVSLDELEANFNKYLYFKVMEDNFIIASARAYREDNCCKIENVIVLPEYQKKGIGTKILNFVEDTFQDCSSFELFTGKSSPGNVDFYKKLGYKIINEIEPTQTEPGLVIMKKKRKGPLVRTIGT